MEPTWNYKSEKEIVPKIPAESKADNSYPVSPTIPGKCFADNVSMDHLSI